MQYSSYCINEVARKATDEKKRKKTEENGFQRFYNVKLKKK